MKSLMLKFTGPMQSWAQDSRYRTREAGTAPTKSGVLGLLAAAQGRRRCDPVEDLAKLEFGVRVDQPGTLERDYQTAYIAQEKKTQPSYRYYLADAVFLTAVAGEDTLIQDLEAAVRGPSFPLFLGRRSCPANWDLLLGIREGGVEQVLAEEPWQAASWYRRRQPRKVSLATYRDARPGEAGDDACDVPISFNPENRQYAWRRVVEGSVCLPNPEGCDVPQDPFLEAVRVP